jgi:glutathione S-transferase
MLLYGHPLSGNTHKVRLLLSALRVAHDEQLVDVTMGAHKAEAFLAKNPRGQLPVLVDGETIIHDAQAILVYLARKCDPTGQWLPTEPADLAHVVGWLSFAANEIQNGAHMARLHYLLGVPVALDQVQGAARASLALLEARLRGRAFLEMDRPTVADLACFPCVALAPEGKVSLADYANVLGWVARIQALPYYVAMPGLEVRR